LWIFKGQLYVAFEIETYLVWHNILEFSSIVVSFIIFLLSWYSYSQLGNRRELFVGIAFFVIGTVDFMHALSFPGMPTFITPNSTGKAIDYWIVARLIQVAALAGSGFIPTRKESRRFLPIALMLGALAIIATTFYSVTFMPQLIPEMFVPGEGLTLTKIWLEYIVVFITLFAIIKYALIYMHTRIRAVLILLMGLSFIIFSELSFTLYASAFDIYNLLGHFFKFGATVSIFLAVFVSSVKEPFLARERAEEELNDSRDRLLKAESLANLGFLDWDLTTDQISLSEEANHIFGLDPEKGIGMLELVAQVVHPDDQEFVQKNLEQAIQGSQALDIDHRIVRPNGEVKWVHAQGVLEHDPNGDPVTLLSTTLDITDRKQAEKEITQRVTELERFNSAMVGREKRMIELKQQINNLSIDLGKEPPYQISFVETEINE
jgi:PAS domain S-box-containing protein